MYIVKDTIELASSIGVLDTWNAGSGSMYADVRSRSLAHSKIVCVVEQNSTNK